MKKKRIMAGVVAFAIALTLFLHAFSPAVSAIVSQNGSITLHVADARTGNIIEGASFRLYFFAAAYEKENGLGYDYVIPYDDCNMDMDNLQDAYLPIHLTHFALTHALPFTLKSSDENGSIVFVKLSYETIESRLKNISTRGITLEKGQTLRDLYDLRQPYYHRWGQIIAEADGQDIEQTVEMLVTRLKEVNQ